MDKTKRPATDKQIACLEAMQKRAEAICRTHPQIIASTPHRNWHEERGRGMTTADASMKIDAYHSLFRSVNFACDLLGIKRP